MADSHREHSRPPQQASSSSSAVAMSGPGQSLSAQSGRSKASRPPPNALLQGQDEEKYQAKYKELKRKVKDTEKSSDELYYKVLQAKKQVSRLRLERGLLYEKLYLLTPGSDVHPASNTASHIPNTSTSPHPISHHRPVDYIPPPSVHPLDDRGFRDYPRPPPPPDVRSSDGRALPDLPPYPHRHDANRQLPPLQHSGLPGLDRRGALPASTSRGSRSAQHQYSYSPTDRHYPHIPPPMEIDKSRALREDFERDRARDYRRGGPHAPPIPIPHSPHSQPSFRAASSFPAGMDREGRQLLDSMEVERTAGHSLGHYSSHIHHDYRDQGPPPMYPREDVSYSRDREYMHSHMRGSRPASPDALPGVSPHQDRRGSPSSSRNHAVAPRSREDGNVPDYLSMHQHRSSSRLSHYERDRNGGSGDMGPSSASHVHQSEASSRKRQYHEVDQESDGRDTRLLNGSPLSNSRAPPSRHDNQHHRTGSDDEHD